MSSRSSEKSESMFRKGIKVGIWLAFNKMGAKGKKVKKDKLELSGLDQDEIDLLNDFVGDIVADGEIDDSERKLLKNWLKPKGPKKNIKKKPKNQQEKNKLVRKTVNKDEKRKRKKRDLSTHPYHKDNINKEKDNKKEERDLDSHPYNNNNTKKICTKCKERKLLSEFYKDKTSKDGYNSICKACRKRLYGKKR